MKSQASIESVAISSKLFGRKDSSTNKAVYKQYVIRARKGLEESVDKRISMVSRAKTPKLGTPPKGRAA